MVLWNREAEINNLQDSALIPSIYYKKTEEGNYFFRLKAAAAQ